DNQNAHGLSVRELADNYKISKSSAANILRRSEELLADYSSNCNKEKARQVAEQLGYTSETFKASNGWLKKFRNRYAISFRTINGESALVDNSTVEEWTQRLSTILDGFDENDVFNADETGLSYRATPDHSLVLSKEECKGGKKSKERLTVLLCSNLTGTVKLKPVVIGKSQRPRCFKNITTSKLPVIWLSNRTAWMTSQTADQISITVLDAIKWIDLSWENVTEKTIKNGFRALVYYTLHFHQPFFGLVFYGFFLQCAASFIHSSSTPSSSMMNMDIIAETDIELNNYDNPLQQLYSLLVHLRIGSSQSTAVEFVDIDSCIPTFNEWDDYEHLKTYIQVTQNDNEEEEEALLEQPPKLSEALEMMRKLHLFASIELPQLHNLISDLESQLTDIYLDSKAAKQSSITDYFSHC
ncbi:unnamed protein product, partial [Rotaria magnacalcarata]